MYELTTERLNELRTILADSLGAFVPEIVLSLTVCALFSADLFARPSGRRSVVITLVGLGLAALALLLGPGGSSAQPLFGWIDAGSARPMLVHDRFGWVFKLIILASTAAIIPMVRLHRDLGRRPLSEFYALLVGASLGMFLMVGASNFLMIFLGIEFASMASYLLTAYVKRDVRGSEAGLKYVVYGSVASAIMLFGLSLLYGMTGSVHLADLHHAMTAGSLNSTACAVASLCMFAGFAYKMAAYPMHFWAPDVYQGASTPVTAYLSVASKAAGFAVFVRFLAAFDSGFKVKFPGFGGALESLDFGWQHVVAVASVLSMTAGNLAALWQRNVKRLLAYSSVAHAGYLLMGVAALQTSAGAIFLQALVFYFIAYFVMNIGAFLIVNLVAARTGSEDIGAFRGLGKRSPILAGCLFLFVLSLIGLPPTGGFVGKLQLLGAAVDGGMVWLAVAAGINTAISVGYYFRLLKAMYFEASPDDEPAGILRHPVSLATVAALALLVLYLGLFPSPVGEWTKTLSI